MVPVKQQPEPDDFDQKVRQRGYQWLRKRGINPLTKIKPDNLDINKAAPIWRACSSDLATAYKNLCAYSAFYIRPAEIHTIDHFLPKSKRLDLAFEWNNFRSCCALVNSKKKDATDILDPFQIQPLWFALNFWDFSIYPSDELPIPLKIQVQHTIDTLGLNRNPFKNRRKFDYDEYKTCPDSLRKYSPFVWQEAERQGYPETAPTGF